VGKYLLSVLGILSLIWTIYVGVNITSSGPALSPGSVFHEKGLSLVVVHKPLEIDFSEPAFQFLAETPFYTTVLEHPERVQHFYFSSSGKTILLERSKPWTIELVNVYFEKMAVKTAFTAAREMTLSNGWKARFNKEFLLITLGDKALSESNTVQWNYVDRKSSASIISWENDVPTIENCYKKTDGILTYISNADTRGKHLADDQDIFLDAIPENFREYTFYEKNYLHSIDEAESPIYDWMNNGLVIVQSGKDRCIITDFISGQDPIAILGDALDESSLNEARTSGFVRNVKLPETILTSESWYLEVFNNRVYIAADKSAIDAFIGAYESGRTISQNMDKFAVLFSNNPKKVSFRQLTPQEHRTISLLNNTRHTVVKKYSSGIEQTAETDNQLEPVRIDGGISQLIPVQGTDFLFAVSKSNGVYGLNKTGERWKVQLDGPLIGEASLSATGDALVLTTASTVYIIGKNGSAIPGYPLTLSAKPVAPAVHYSWKGKEKLAVTDGQSLTIYEPSKKSVVIRLPFESRETPFIVWVNNGELTATIAGETKGVNISIDRQRKLKEFALPATELTPVKTENGPLFYGIENNRLIFITTKGEKTDLGSAKKLLGFTKDAKQTVILVQSGNTVKSYSETGNLLGSVKTSFNEAESASLLKTAGGKTVVGILDGLSNNNYIYGLNGLQLTTQSFEGAALVVLHRQQNGQLLLLSQSNGYLVRYPAE